VKRVRLEHVEERIGEFLSGDCLDFGEVLVHRGPPRHGEFHARLESANTPF
jgi:hypothetical protein